MNLNLMKFSCLPTTRKNLAPSDLMQAASPQEGDSRRSTTRSPVTLPEFSAKDGVPPLHPEKSPFGLHDAGQRRLNFGGTATDLASCPEEGASKWVAFDGLVLSWGSATSIGERSSLEDTMLGVPDLQADVSAPRSSLFAVFDGHGGVEAAEFARDSLPALISTHPNYALRPGEALNTAFLKLDELFYQSVKDDDPPHQSGSTLLAALLVGNDLWLANAGDSRAVISCRGKAEDLTEDHRPNSETEANRIRSLEDKPPQTLGIAQASSYICRGYISDGYLCGQLGVTRGIGDFHVPALKRRVLDEPSFQGPLTSEPTISMRTLKAEDEFIVMACDGLWDLWPSQRVIEIARRSLQLNNNDPKRCAQHLVEQSEARHATDNVTVIVVCLSDTAPPRRDTSDLKRSVSQNGIASIQNALQRAELHN